MLTYLKITNYALIESAELEFGPGFNVVTGESGAGKSILMGSVELLLGGRASRGVLRTGADRCTISGSFTVPPHLVETVGTLLDEAGIPFDRETAELQIRRVITASTVRNFINDTPVGARLLAEIGGQLVDLHGANEQLSLTVPARQLELLDHYAGNGELRNRCAELVAALDRLDEERREFDRSIPDETELSRLELLAEEIDRVNPLPGEDEELSAKHKLASNSRQVIETAGRLTEALTDGEDSLADRLGDVYRSLQELARIDETLTGGLLTECDAIRDEVNSLSESVSALADKVDLDAEALAAIETRLGELFTLKRRYGPSLTQVLDARAEAAERLANYARTRERREEFDARRQELTAELADAARRLSEQRHECAARFADEVRAKLGAIGFGKSRLEVEFTTVEPGPTGMDRIELMFSANAGEALQPLRKIASSGELSRLMLALKTVLADADSIPVVVFDEIDVNIGGETANRVGEELHNLGRHRQILCISHLAQVAARADRHYCVVKHTEGDRTFSESRLLNDRERAAEIARMLGGGDSALVHARSILRNLRATRD